jgi:hypothetical protein
MATAFPIQRAADIATDFLRLYSPNKPPMGAFGVSAFSDSNVRILEALQEAQVVMNEASTRAFEQRVEFLDKARTKQVYINAIHLLTGSAFVLLIAGLYPVVVKWAGAILSLSAGVVALFLPKNASLLERTTSEDVSHVASLTGQIANLQADLQYGKPDNADRLYKKIGEVIGECAQLARKYQLDEIATKVGYLPRRISSTEPTR